MLRAFATVFGTTALLASACPTAAAAEEASGGDTLEEVIVTAEKQTRSLQKTAAAVTAISAESLVEAGVTDLREAQKLVPSVRFQAEGNNTQVFVRGVGANLDQPNVEPNVAFNLAGIYLPREAASAGFFDIAQMEVLPGPQGTLYGRSAIGGTINVTPTRPDFNNDGSMLLEIGNYSAVHGTMAQNLRASDAVAFRLALDYYNRDGVMTTGADSKDDLSARLSTLVQSGDALSVYLWAQGARRRGHTENLVNKGLNPQTGEYCESCFLHDNPWNDTREGELAGPFGIPDAERNDYETAMIAGQIDYELENSTLTYLPSYLYLDAVPFYWLSAIQSSNAAHYNQITHELRLASRGEGPLEWLGGLYYYNVRNSGYIQLFSNLPFAFLQSNVEANRHEGYAGFGQATYSFTDDFRTTLGARYSSTHRTGSGLEPLALGGLPYDFDKTYTNVDWKIGVEKDLAPGRMIYAHIQTGYQPGTFNELPNTDTFDNEVKASSMLSYTAGFKSRWLEDRLQVNSEIYYYDYRDLLIQSYNIAAAYNMIFNAKKVSIKGAQLDVLAQVFTAGQLNLNAGYSRARNDDFTTPDGLNYDGLQLAYAPDWSAALGYTHSFDIGPGTLRAHVDWQYESSWYADYVHNRGVRQDPWEKGNASLTYERGNWSVGAWIKNIQNRAVIAATAAAGVPGPGTAYLDEPRTYGVRFNVRYGRDK